MTELEDVFYDKSKFIETQSANKVSKESVLCGSQNIRISGKTIVHTNCMIRGDLANVYIGKHCNLGENSVIRPPAKLAASKDGKFGFIPLTIGDCVNIGENCVINAAQIGSYVKIGKNCVIGRRCILKDCCEVGDDSVLAPDTVVPPFTLVKGSPGRIVAELPECTKELHREHSRSLYAHFLPKPNS